MSAKQEVKFVIVTGLSGAGKTQAIRLLEDADYFCVDNLPPALVPKFAELCAQAGGHVTKVALGMDIRGGEFFGALHEALAYLSHHEWQHQVLFLEAAEDVLIRRFKETRRRHPLSGEDSILEGIRRERETLSGLRAKADKVIDTSALTPAELKLELQNIFLREQRDAPCLIRAVSFGYKHGIPLDADFVFDCRFLPNPFYVAELKNLTGLDSSIRQYVFQDQAAERYLGLVMGILDFVMPYCQKEGKTQVVVALGCTGGKHRSVAMVEVLREMLQKSRHRVAVEHRHISEGV